MISFMTADTLSKLYVKEGSYVYNLTSFKMGFEKINLAPPYQCTSLEPKFFDMMYAKFILENDSIFSELMKIISPVFEGSNVYILITIGDGWDMITESLQKFLQQRYNIISTICYEPDDYDELGNQVIMNQSSMYNFNTDRARFLNLFVRTNGQKALMQSIVTEDNFIKEY